MTPEELEIKNQYMDSIDRMVVDFYDLVLNIDNDPFIYIEYEEE